MTRKAQSTITVTEPAEPGADTVIRKVNRRVDALLRTQPRRVLLLDETIETEEMSSSGYTKAHVTLAARWMAGGKVTPAFTISSDGSFAAKSAAETLYVISDRGCCGANDTHSVFSLTNGRRLFVTGGQGDPILLTLEVGSTDLLYHVGVHRSGTVRDAETYGNSKHDKEDALLVTLASPTETLQSFVLVFDGRPTRAALPDVRWANPPTSGSKTWKRIAKGETAVLEIVMNDVDVIRIPVRDGRISTESLSLPAGIQLRSTGHDETKH